MLAATAERLGIDTAEAARRVVAEAKISRVGEPGGHRQSRFFSGKYGGPLAARVADRHRRRRDEDDLTKRTQSGLR